MADEAAVMVDQDGYPTPVMMGRWRAKGALKALQPNPIVDDDGMALEGFSSLWRAAFPDHAALPPNVAITGPDGRFTDDMLTGAWL